MTAMIELVTETSGSLYREQQAHNTETKQTSAHLGHGAVIHLLSLG